MSSSRSTPRRFIVDARSFALALGLFTGGVVDLGGTLNVNVHGVDVDAGGITGAGTLDASGGGDVDTGGGLTVGTYTNGAGTLTFDGTGDWGSATEQNYGRVTVDAGTVTLVGDVLTTGDLTIASTLDLDGRTLRAEGDLSVVPGGSLTAGAGSGVTFSGAASPQTVSLPATAVPSRARGRSPSTRPRCTW